jgi:hypothetical protein
VRLSLDPAKIVDTVERLARRIRERFPDANLGKVADELARIARESATRVEELRRPNVGLRAGVVLLLAGLVAVLGVLVNEVHVNWHIQGGTDLVQTLDAGLESLFFVGGAIVFLVTLESRQKRKKALAVIHQLRSLAHIVGMHQLTKDPDQLLARAPPTESSPTRTMSNSELQRYLDYSSEMLALTSKVAALYVAGVSDPVVLSAVDDIEDLTAGLSRKIWQKITIVNQIGETG